MQYYNSLLLMNGYVQLFICIFRDHFYQYGEIRSINVVSKQQCAFVQFTNRSSAEAAGEKSFNKLILNGRRLNIKWGKSQGQQGQDKEAEEDEEEDQHLEPVPGLPAGNDHDYGSDVLPFSS